MQDYEAYKSEALAPTAPGAAAADGYGGHHSNNAASGSLSPSLSNTTPTAPFREQHGEGRFAPPPPHPGGPKGCIPPGAHLGEHPLLAGDQQQHHHFASYHSDESNASCSNEEALSLAKLYPERFPSYPPVPGSYPSAPSVGAPSHYPASRGPPPGVSYGHPHAHHLQQHHPHPHPHQHHPQMQGMNGGPPVGRQSGPGVAGYKHFPPVGGYSGMQGPMYSEPADYVTDAMLEGPDVQMDEVDDLEFLLQSTAPMPHPGPGYRGLHVHPGHPGGPMGHLPPGARQYPPGYGAGHLRKSFSADYSHYPPPGAHAYPSPLKHRTLHPGMGPVPPGMHPQRRHLAMSEAGLLPPPGAPPPQAPVSSTPPLLKSRSVPLPAGLPDYDALERALSATPEDDDDDDDLDDDEDEDGGDIKATASEGVAGGSLTGSAATTTGAATTGHTNKRRGKGGRTPAMDPRLDPNIDPKKAKRILANRQSAARSKLKQRLLMETLKGKHDVLTAHKENYARELDVLKKMCKELESKNQSLLEKIHSVEAELPAVGPGPYGVLPPGPVGTPLLVQSKKATGPKRPGQAGKPVALKQEGDSGQPQLPGPVGKPVASLPPQQGSAAQMMAQQQQQQGQVSQQLQQQSSQQLPSGSQQQAQQQMW